MKKKSTQVGALDIDLWLTKSKSGGRSKVTTRCVSDNNQYYKENIINSNRTTTRSWPVICRQPKSYDNDDYETVFALNNNHLNSSHDDLSAQGCHKSNGQYDADLIRTINSSRTDNSINNSNNQTSMKMQPPTSNSVMGMSAATCTSPPPVVFLMITLLMTVSATAMLCGAVITDYWEVIQWDRDAIQAKIPNNTQNRLHWLLGGRVAKISGWFNGNFLGGKSGIQAFFYCFYSQIRVW